LNANESGVYSNDKFRIKLYLQHNTIFLFNSGGKSYEIKKHNSQFYSDKSVITFALMFSYWAQSTDDKIFILITLLTEDYILIIYLFKVVN